MARLQGRAPARSSTAVSDWRHRDQRRARRARLGSAALHGHCVRDLLQRAPLGRGPGWIGLEQYDEANKVGQAFLDDYEAAYGHRPEYYGPLLWRDCAMSLLYAFADAAPLSPRGVRDALERVKMLPAACGSPGTRISLGPWLHRGWVGAGYLMARSFDDDGKELGKYWKSSLVGRYGQD